MNWFFCCGDESHKTKEKNQTVDLSKPIMQELKINDASELEGLSGKLSA